MPAISIECPSCGWEGKIDEKLVGRKLKCSKCGEPFVAEVGGTYDLAGAPPTDAPAPRGPRAAGPARAGAPEPSPEDESPEGEGRKSWLEGWPAE